MHILNFIISNQISGKWTGHWARDHYKLYPSVPEMFLYSNKDFYLKADYMEKNVLSLREIEGSQYKAFKFTGSKHVAHLRMHKKEYINQIQNFIQMEPQEQDQKKYQI